MVYALKDQAQATKLDYFQKCDIGQDSDDECVEVGGPYDFGAPQNKDNTFDEDAQAKLAVLSYEQICRLNDVMEETVSIVGRGNFPTLEIRLRDLVDIVRAKLEGDPTAGGAGMRVRDIRLNGGAASHVLAAGQDQPYNDVDLIFGVELSSPRNFDKVKAAVLSSLYDMLPDGVSRKRISTCSLKEAYVSKMVKVNNQSDSGDRWSLISLGCQRGRGVELKFVDRMRRQFEFSVDSFQIVLDSLLLFYRCATTDQDGNPTAMISENFYPTVVGESVFGDFQEALYHLQKRLISTRRPEEIRGGGLLKYCMLLVKNYRPAHPDYIRLLERYMCSRFFIDFSDVTQQRSKLETYLWNHFGSGPEEAAARHRFLLLLHDVVAQSTVCLMGHERRQTLHLIKNLAWQVLYQDQGHQQQQPQHMLAPPQAAPAVPPLVIANGYIYAPITIATSPCQFCGCGSSWMTCCST
ncbi:terminal nucleotidyltransferase 5C isoform X2 [Anthonomus grandis grandis]|uniref:terminal nucleotidyltransferase 5C isoform X2 n=1 Tax=Anthonomus grandis grandis TaxID=2921223 RepID=UPI002166476A|nr:terminal nucleotidyltransferase 5C isoform X2 [Anthonomus grandis grandis]